MLEDAGGIRRVILACGFVDLLKGIDGPAQVIGSQYNLNPFEKGTLFLFCGRRSDRMKGLLWMGNGFLLLYKRFEDGSMAKDNTGSCTYHRRTVPPPDAGP
jgi:transposase